MTAAAPNPPATFKGTPVDLVVDVRSKLEFWTGHLPGAVCIPVHQIPAAFAGRSDVSPKSRILVYCASGGRSAAAAAALRTAGYRHVVDGGGIGSARQHFRA